MEELKLNINKLTPEVCDAIVLAKTGKDINGISKLVHDLKDAEDKIKTADQKLADSQLVIAQLKSELEKGLVQMAAVEEKVKSLQKALKEKEVVALSDESAAKIAALELKIAVMAQAAAAKIENL